MILDSCAHAGLYRSMNKHFEAAFKFLNDNDLAAMAEGRYEIDGDNVFVMVNERDLKNPSDAALEVHDKYVDIQVVLRGEESFGWKDRSDCTMPRGTFDAQKDILFFDDQPTTYFTLQPGQMAIFLPGDAHAPLVGDGKVKKAIFKVKVL